MQGKWTWECNKCGCKEYTEKGKPLLNAICNKDKCLGMMINKM